MPCSISDEEARWFEREANKEKYGKRISNAAASTAAACEAGKLLEAAGLLKQASPFLRAWLKVHAQEDQERGR